MKFWEGVTVRRFLGYSGAGHAMRDPGPAVWCAISSQGVLRGWKTPWWGQQVYKSSDELLSHSVAGRHYRAFEELTVGFSVQ